MAESEWIKRDLLGRSQSWLLMRLYIYIAFKWSVSEETISCARACCFSASKRHSVTSDSVVSPHGPKCSRDLVFRQHVPTHRITLHRPQQVSAPGNSVELRNPGRCRFVHSLLILLLLVTLFHCFKNLEVKVFGHKGKYILLNTHTTTNVLFGFDYYITYQLQHVLIGLLGYQTAIYKAQKTRT